MGMRKERQNQRRKCDLKMEDTQEVQIVEGKKEDKKEYISLGIIIFLLFSLLVGGIYAHSLENKFNECAVKFNEISRKNAALTPEPKKELPVLGNLSDIKINMR